MTPSFRDASDTDDPTLQFGYSLRSLPWLGLTDLLSFPSTFTGSDAWVEAAESILVRGRSFHQDLENFLSDARKRVAKAVQWRSHGAEWITGYPGVEKSLAGLQLDLGNGVMSSPTGPINAPAALVDYAQRLSQTRGAPPENETAHKYVALWYESIARLCNEMGARLIVLRIPRGPFLRARWTRTCAAWRACRTGFGGQADAHPPDGVHVSRWSVRSFSSTSSTPNRKGRETFSPMLANEVAQILAKPRHALQRPLPYWVFFALVLG